MESSYFQPLERFEQIRARTVGFGDRLCDLAYANPYGGPDPRAVRALADALDDRRRLQLQYSPYGGKTLARRKVAEALRESHRHEFRYEDVVLTPGAMAGLHLALRESCEPGDEVLIPVPCWLDYPLYCSYLDLVPVPVPREEPNFALAPDRLRAHITDRTRAIIVTQPDNPTGRVHEGRQLRELASVLSETEEEYGRPVTVISDETHREFVPRSSYLSPAREWPRTLIVYSFGKIHRLQGQRTGYVAVPPEHPERSDTRRALVRLVRAAGFCTPTGLMQSALPDLLDIRYDLEDLIERKRDFRTRLTEAGYSVTPSPYTFFLYVETPGGRGDFDFARVLAEEGVLVLPAPVFHHRGHFRVSLTAETDRLDRALDVLSGAVAP